MAKRTVKSKIACTRVTPGQKKQLKKGGKGNISNRLRSWFGKK